MNVMWLSHKRIRAYEHVLHVSIYYILSLPSLRLLMVSIVRMRAFRRKTVDSMYGFNGAVLDLRNGAVSEKNPQLV